jgi:hypothetical protein
MAYKSVAPSLKISCYNCQFFQVSGDMMNGKCFLSPASTGKSAIGIGTCEHFAIKEKGGDHLPWSNLINEKMTTVTT